MIQLRAVALINACGLVQNPNCCPNKSYKSSGIYVCSKTGEKLPENNTTEFPPFCPLPIWSTERPEEVTQTAVLNTPICHSSKEEKEDMRKKLKTSAHDIASQAVAAFQVGT